MVQLNGVKNGALALLLLVGLVIGYFALTQIGGLTVGTITNTATSGAINVSSAMDTHLLANEGSYINVVDSVSDNWPVLAGILIIVVLITVFGLKFNFGRMTGGGKKGGLE